MAMLSSVPYDIENVPHRTWMKALWMMRGDTTGAKRLAKLLDASILPIVEDAEKLFGGRVTARILLERGVAELLAKVEDRQLGRLSGRVRRRVHHWYGSIPVANQKVLEPKKRDTGNWLGLCGPDQVTWTVNGVRIPNETIAEQTLREAAAEGTSPPKGDYSDHLPSVVSTGESDGPDLEAYVRCHLRYCGRLPRGATYLGTIRSQEDVEEARQVPGSFAVQDGNGEWMLLAVDLGRAGQSP